MSSSVTAPDDRPSWDEVWIGVAAVVARRSLCVRDQVGSVVVDARNRVVATGYNGPPAGFPRVGLRRCDQWCSRGAEGSGKLDSDYRDCPALHAELNALSVCDRSTREGGTIYVTSHSCHNCCKAIANSGLARLVVCPTLTSTHRQSDTWYTFLRNCGIIVEVCE